MASRCAAAAGNWLTLESPLSPGMHLSPSTLQKAAIRSLSRGPGLAKHTSDASGDQRLGDSLGSRKLGILRLRHDKLLSDRRGPVSRKPNKSDISSEN